VFHDSQELNAKARSSQRDAKAASKAKSDCFLRVSSRTSRLCVKIGAESFWSSALSRTASMSLRLLCCASLVLGLAVVGEANPPPLKDVIKNAKPPLPGESGTKSRLPNDQIEGAVWQYRAVQKQKDGTENVKEGNFRIEEKGIYRTDTIVKVPPVEKPGKIFDAIKSGQGGTVKIPQPNPKGDRIGDVTKLSDGKTKLVFIDKDFPLQGNVIVWAKKDRPGVLMGYVAGKDSDKAGERWTLELRELKD